MDSSNIEEPGILQTGISRRTMIKAGAIVGATLWVAPVVESFITPASAASFGAGCVQCYYLDNSTNEYVLFGAFVDDPTPNTSEPSVLCAGGTGGTGAAGITSGPFVLFNTNQANFLAVNTSHECTYGSSGTTLLTTNPFPTVPTCPSTPTPNIVCSTGYWTA